MATREEVSHDQRLSGPIQVTASAINNSPRHPREVEVDAVDSEKNPLRIILWKKHDVDAVWVEGQTYQIQNVRGKVYERPNGKLVELHSTQSIQVDEVGQSTKPTKLLVLGDSHVGYRHRNPSGKASWAQNVDNRETLERTLSRASRAGVSAVVHTGDIFDHGATDSDRNRVGEKIDELVREGTQFYYVQGNHDTQPSRMFLDTTSGMRLTTDAVPVGEGDVNLIGVDHRGSKFPTDPPNPSIDTLLRRTLLIIHETPYPFVDEDGSTCYTNDPNRATLTEFIESARFDIDLVITGHMHVANRGRIRSTGTPVLVTGPTAPISSYKRDNEPSAWLLTITDGGVSVDRQPL